MKIKLLSVALVASIFSINAFSHTCASKISAIFPYKDKTYVTPKSQCVINGNTINSFIVPSSDFASKHMMSVILAAYATQDNAVFHFSGDGGGNTIMDGIQIVK